MALVAAVQAIPNFFQVVQQVHFINGFGVSGDFKPSLSSAAFHLPKRFVNVTALYFPAARYSLIVMLSSHLP
jgi:hypothetical protein